MLGWYHAGLLYITTMTKGSAGVSIIFQTLHECYDASKSKNKCNLEIFYTLDFALQLYSTSFRYFES